MTGLSGHASCLFLIALWACGCNPTHVPAGSDRDEEGAPAHEKAVGPAGLGAFDVIKLARLSDEIGPVYFAHALHADLKDASGATIECVRCHHEVDGEYLDPPLGCSNCHQPHDHVSKRGLPST